MKGSEEQDEYEENNRREVYEENGRIRKRDGIQQQIDALSKMLDEMDEHNAEQGDCQSVIDEISMLEQELKIV